MGLSWLASPSAEPLLRRIAEVLEPLGAGRLSGEGSGGADVSPLRPFGVPLFAVQQDFTSYFDFHHTANDTFDKVEPASLDRVVAAVAAFAYAAADTPVRFERIPVPKRATPTP
jgi:hypothetical protein